MRFIILTILGLLVVALVISLAFWEVSAPTHQVDKVITVPAVQR